jgi:hypothetical protein
LSRIFANKAAEEMGHVHGMLRKPMQHPQEKTSKSKHKLIIPWKGCRIKEVHGQRSNMCRIVKGIVPKTSLTCIVTA